MRKGEIQRKHRVVNLHELLLRILPEWDGVHLVRRVREWYLRAHDRTSRVPGMRRGHVEQQREQLVLGLLGWYVEQRRSGSLYAMPCWRLLGRSRVAM